MTAKTSKSLRLFYALWPDDATSSALMQLQSPMHGRIVPYSNLHLTLVFLGQQSAALLPDLKDILNRLPRSGITLTLDHVGYFPHNRIAWAGMRHIPDKLFTLHRALMQALLKRKVAFNGQHDYKPHVTLARDASLPPDLAFDPIAWQADRAVLVQSTTTTEGSIYRILASRALDKDVWVPDESGQDGADAAQ